MATGDRIRLVVLFGGQSAEHDVSCTTAAHVLRAADPAKYEITPGRHLPRWSLGDRRGRACRAGRWARRAARSPRSDGNVDHAGRRDRRAPSRTVVVPLLHGPMGEDGTVQGLLELANIPYVGSGVLGSALAMDKAMAKQVLAANGIAAGPVPRVPGPRDHTGPACSARRRARAAAVRQAGQHGLVGRCVEGQDRRGRARRASTAALTYDEWVVVEEAIVGREIEVAVLGNLEPRASLPGEIVPGAEFYDYADKYLDDGSQTLVPAPLTPEQSDEVRAMALQVFKVLRCEGLARVDFFFEEHGRGFLCNEVNTMPGFTPISMYPKMWIASGLSYPELIDELVRLAIERHGRQRRNTAH